MRECPFTFESVLSVAYPHLLKLSHGIFNSETKIPGLSSRDCLHEAIVQNWHKQFNDSAHLYRFMTLVIRRRIIDYVRAQRVRQRVRTELEILTEAPYPLFESIDVVDVEIALHALENGSERSARVAALYYVLGLGNEEIEAVVGVSPVTVNRDLRQSTQWLMNFWNNQDEIRSSV